MWHANTDCFWYPKVKGSGISYTVTVTTVYLCSTLFYLMEHMRLLIVPLGCTSSLNITSETDHVAEECVLVYKFHHLEMIDRVNMEHSLAT